MSVRVSLRKLEQQLPALLERVAKDGEECVVQRNGKDYAVIIGVQQWRRRTVGRRLDALSRAAARPGQAGAGGASACGQGEPASDRGRAARAGALLRESEAILRRRSAALNQLT